jgi:2-polyprenyl-3-methyl-5-hydroxy-6-metoxy-1,4-benzoquinol methylase/Flp pilus assembly protein TadD
MSQALRQQTVSEATKDLMSAKEWKDLQRKALYHYDKSLDAKTRSEQTVSYRGIAKEHANRLRTHEPSRVVALNLLARIALDEGFYHLADHHLSEAIEITPEDAGCWYSLGHVRLAQKKHDDALDCFSKSLSIAPRETRAASSIAYTLATIGRVVEAFQAYRDLFRLHPNDLHIQAKLFEITPHIKADFYQRDLEKDVIAWLSIKRINHQALSTLVMSLLKTKYQLENPNAIVDLQDLAKDRLLNLSLGKIYFTDNKIEEFICLIRKQVLLNSIAGEYKDRALLELAGNLAMNAEHNEHIYMYDSEERDLICALKTLINDFNTQPDTNLSSASHLLVLYAMYEPLLGIGTLKKATQLQAQRWPKYAKTLIKHAVTDVNLEIEISKDIELLSPITNATSLDVKQQYEESPYPRWLHLGYNTPTNYGRALERELVGFRAPEFFNMGTVNVLIAGAGTGKHALRVAQYFRNVEVLALDLSRRSLAYAKRKAEDLGIQNIRFLSGDILELNNLEAKFHVIECSGVLHHMTEPEAGLALLKDKLVDRGLLKLGLYSYQARSIVRQMRGLIQQYELPPTAQGIRTMRQAILTGKMPYDFNGILSSEDFYSLSGCRDLLFHVQEIQYEPHELKTLIAREKLKFLGFIVSEGVRAQYREQFPEDERLVDLENWQVYETQNPNTFAGMFQFYVQK